jgi:hypothetical protein
MSIHETQEKANLPVPLSYRAAAIAFADGRLTFGNVHVVGVLSADKKCRHADIGEKPGKIIE